MPLDPRAIIAGGENAKTEFGRDDRDLRPERLAREIAAFANMNGGMIVIGAEDDGTVSGVTRRNLQAWLMDTVLVNAFAHRDWTRPSDVQLTVYADRLEVHSPGSLPNDVTVEKAKEGLRVPRNPNIVNILRDYDFMEHRGMGIRRKVIPLTRAHNGTDPQFHATEDYFRVTLHKEARRALGPG